MKPKLFILLGLIVFVIVACNTETKQKQPACNKPYILVGNDCCLDKNDNAICDSDESGNEIEENTESACNKPYILVGTDCCLDKDDNQICDKDETIKEEETEALTIDDLQADIGNVLEKVIFLTKDAPLSNAVVYSNKISNAKFLGKYSDVQFSKLLTKKPEIIIQITEDFLEEKEDFENFVIKNKNIFIESALNSKEQFENEFKEGKLLKMIALKKVSSDLEAEKAEYVSHSDLSSVIYYDNVTFPETVSENIAEINYIRVNKYDLELKVEANKYSERLSNINYGQSIVIRCSPNIVIGLSFEEYGEGSNPYERNYDGLKVESSFFLTPIREHSQQLIIDSQALIKMCEQRYEFTYLRWR